MNLLNKIFRKRPESAVPPQPVQPQQPIVYNSSRVSVSASSNELSSGTSLTFLSSAEVAASALSPRVTPPMLKSLFYRALAFRELTGVIGEPPADAQPEAPNADSVSLLWALLNNDPVFIEPPPDALFLMHNLDALNTLISDETTKALAKRYGPNARLPSFENEFGFTTSKIYGILLLSLLSQENCIVGMFSCFNQENINAGVHSFINQANANVGTLSFLNEGNGNAAGIMFLANKLVEIVGAISDDLPLQLLVKLDLIRSLDQKVIELRKELENVEKVVSELIVINTELLAKLNTLQHQ